MAEALAIPDLEIVGTPEADREEDEWLFLLPFLLGQRRDAARQSWAAAVPAEYAGMIDATLYAVRQAVPPQPPAWWFLRDEQRYGIGTRRLVLPDAVQATVDAYSDAMAAEIERTTRAMMAGSITLSQWQSAMRDTLIAYQIALAAVAGGGVGQLTDEDDRRLAAALAFALVRLGVFARALSDGTYTDPDAVLRRAGYYAADARQQYEASRYASHVAVGYRFAFNVLDAASESCSDGTPEVPGCVELTEAGWIPIDDMILPGGRRCSFQCRCRVEYRR
ncbi:MAG TPA: hypothetical protein VGN72_06575 [Tepidisphaeraceae bacterium]|jgi:hypothetical protein|nr:hypothetical protein [Tepidisphaeraceae bacterium]